jgi:hypothetical protein
VIQKPQINLKIHDAFRGLKITEPEYQKRLLYSNNPDLRHFGLDQFARDLSRENVFALLRQKDTDIASKLALLPKLRVFLEKYPADLELLENINQYLELLLSDGFDFNACELICSTLDKIIRDLGSGSTSLNDMSIKFHNELEKRKTFKLNRVLEIENLIGKANFPDARHELEILSSQGIDLEKSFFVKEGIKQIFFSSISKKIILFTYTGILKIINPDLSDTGILVSLAGSESLYSQGHNSVYQHVCFDRTKVKLFDDQFNLQKSIEYNRRITCAEAYEFSESLYWVIGFEDSRIVLAGLEGQPIQDKLSSLPVKIIRKNKGNFQNFYLLTLDCSVYKLIDSIDLGADGEKRRTYKIQQIFQLPSIVNVLDFMVIEDDTDEIQLFLLTIDTLIHVRKNLEKEYSIRYISLKGRHATAFIIRPKSDDLEFIIGTEEFSVLFLCSDGTFLKEVHFSDIPTTLFLTQRTIESPGLLIGFAHGNLHQYRFISDKDIEKLNKLCDRSKEFNVLWKTYSLEEKLVLIAVSKIEAPDFQEIQNYFDKRIRILIPESNLLRAVKKLSENGTIKSLMKDTRVRYFGGDDEFFRWISLQKDPFESMQEGRAEIIEIINLIDICRIERSFQQINENKWLYDYLLVDKEKWGRLLDLSEIITDVESNPDNPEYKKKYFKFICNQVKAIELNSAKPEYETIDLFEMEMPLINFLGFNDVLVVIVKDGENGRLRSDLKTLVQNTPYQITLLLTRDNKYFLRESLRSEISSSFAVLDTNDLKHILLADSPREEFLNLLVEQVNIAALSPFRIAGPVQKMFFGRKNEIQRIMNSITHSGAKCYAIIGPRRIGKTSLIFRIQAELKKYKNFQTIFVDCLPYKSTNLELYNAILSKLEIVERPTENGEFVRILDSFCKQHSVKLVILLDEVDRLLNYDVDNNFTNTLHALINEAGIKIIIAGYSTLYFQMREIKSPLFNMLERLELSSIEAQDSFTFIQETFRNIYKISNTNIEYILENTGGYPNFIQFCCKALVEKTALLKERTISQKDIDRVLSSQDLYDHMVQVFLDNLDEKSLLTLYLLMTHFDKNLGKFITDSEEHKRSITSAYAGRARKYEIGGSFTPYELHQIMEFHNIRLGHQELDLLMRKLVLASVLKPEPAEKSYSFTLSHLPEILKRHMEIELTAVNFLERIDEIFKK